MVDSAYSQNALGVLRGSYRGRQTTYKIEGSHQGKGFSGRIHGNAMEGGSQSDSSICDLSLRLQPIGAVVSN